MIQPWALLGAEIDLHHEQPLPWNAPEVHVSFHDGQAFACRVSRCPGDLLRVEAEGRRVAAGTRVEIQWTQQGRGGFAAGTVIDAPDSEEPGVYIRIDESVAGIERRLGLRLPVRVGAVVTTPSGLELTGHTLDLSLTGARIVAFPFACRAFLQDLRHAPEEVWGAHTTVRLDLPTGVADLTSLVVSVNEDAGHVRIRFLNNDGLATEQIGAFLRVEQRRIALRGRAS
ncbi:PilZ domain-containing protein [Actinoplanes philippinensis]|uniref:PilZ domain-containing protein n=1 Tax=Actinoplanes philippinensis TaxID=35752 RepID=UPI00340208B7